MGTNYYTVSNVCECCGRHDRDLHIGKSSVGWTFSFRGYRASYYDEPIIESYQQWLGVLEGQRIFNEYGDEITLEKFKELVESKRGEKYNHTIYCRTEHPEHAKDCWLDAEGNSFSGTEFS